MGGLLAHGAHGHEPALVSGHLGHVLAVAVPLLTCLAVVTLDSVRARRAPAGLLLVAPDFLTVRSASVTTVIAPPASPAAPPVARQRTPAVQRLAVVASIAAGLVHLAVVPSHLSESATVGLFFVGVAVAQLGWAAAVVRGTPGTLRSGLLANAALMVIWAVSRSVGAEPVGTLDLLAVSCELVLVGCVVQVMREESRSSA